MWIYFTLQMETTIGSGAFRVTKFLHHTLQSEEKNSEANAVHAVVGLPKYGKGAVLSAMKLE